jgi:hypothetical protein
VTNTEQLGLLIGAIGLFATGLGIGITVGIALG